MKKLIFSLVTSFPIFLCAGQYVGLDFGTDYPYRTNGNSGNKVGLKSAFTCGYQKDNIKLEGEVSYRHGKKQTTYVLQEPDQVKEKQFHSFHSWSYMINALYEIDRLEYAKLIPFIGFGVGYTQNTEKNKDQGAVTHEDKLKNSRFSYQAIGGLSYPFSDTLKVKAQYNYFIGRNHCKNHNVSFGVERSF